MGDRHFFIIVGIYFKTSPVLLKIVESEYNSLYYYQSLYIISTQTKSGSEVEDNTVDGKFFSYIVTRVGN